MWVRWVLLCMLRDPTNIYRQVILTLKKGASSVFFSHFFSKQFTRKLRWQAVKWKLSGDEGNEEMAFPFPLPSAPSSSRFLSPLGASVTVSLSLHHSADRRVRQVELARDVSGWVLLQRWREMGGKGGGETHNKVSFLDKRRIWQLLFGNVSNNYLKHPFCSWFF